MEAISDRPRGVDDLITLISSAVSAIALVFTLVLYAHYFHLHTYNNHIFVVVCLGCSFLLNLNTFINVFAFPAENDRFTAAHCAASGFIHETLSVTIFVSAFLCWCEFAAQVRKWSRLTIRSTRGVVVTGLLSLAIGVAAAGTAFGSDIIHYYRQSWCHGGSTWYVVAFQAVPLVSSVIPMIVTVEAPLRSARVNSDQKGLLIRRIALHSAWVLLELWGITGTIFRSSSFAKGEQAALEPLSSVVLALGFLISERMLTFRALGLPPGADPPQGFTNAMHYIPDKLYYSEVDSAMRDTTHYHNIRY